MASWENIFSIPCLQGISGLFRVSIKLSIEWKTVCFFTSWAFSIQAKLKKIIFKEQKGKNSFVSDSALTLSRLSGGAQREHGEGRSSFPSQQGTARRSAALTKGQPRSKGYKTPSRARGPFSQERRRLSCCCCVAGCSGLWLFLNIFFYQFA